MTMAVRLLASRGQLARPNKCAVTVTKTDVMEMPVTELADGGDADRALPVIGRGPASGTASDRSDQAAGIEADPCN